MKNKKGDKNKGQALTEYVILLAIVTVLGLAFVRSMRPVFAQFSHSVADSMETALFGANLHQFPLGGR